MSGLRRRIVLWDTDECKIPASLDAVGAVNNISRALAAKGYHGCREITAFGEIYTGGNDFFYAGIGTRPCDPDDGDKKLDMILVDLLCHAVGNQGRVTFLLILGNNVSGHSVGLIRALRYLKSKKGYGLVLAQANQVSEKLHDLFSHAWLWEDLALELEPIPPPSRRGYVDVGIEDKVGPFVSAKTSVFWNMQDCRIPDGLSAVDVLRNVSSALADKGYADGSVISFYTYGDGNQIKGLEESTGVVVVPCFLPTGDRAAKLDRVLVDFLCCAVDNPQGRNLLLILGDLEGSQFDLAAMLMGDKLYNCLLAQPNDAPQGQLLGAVCEKWRWESLAAGEKPLLPDHRYPQAIIDLDKHLATLALDDDK